jgi:hypothetical protein
MAKQKQDKEHADGERQKRQQVDAIIGQHVIHTLGQPGGLRGIQVRELWKDHYRVNVLVGADAVSTTVAHSYFLVADGDGKIIASTPMISRVY